jgi:tetratricopeptide (TPR) repeat protein
MAGFAARCGNRLRSWWAEPPGRSALWDRTTSSRLAEDSAACDGEEAGRWAGRGRARPPHNLRALLAVTIAVAACAAAQNGPTFTHDIAPIVYQSCSPCHHPGEAAPFSLLSYDDVKKRAAQIATVTRSGYMPPWLPEAGYGEFADARRLSAEQIRLIGEWVADGAPEGPPGGIRPPRFADGWQLGAPDLVLEAPAAFSLAASGPDVFWNFVFPVKLPETRYVRAMEIRPGNRRLVHHANLLIDRTASAHRQESTPSSGFPGMEVTLLRSPFDPDGHFLFWKPGGAPHVEPAGFSWRLDPGDELVLNAHLQPSGKPEQVRPAIGLYFTDQPPRRFPLLVQLENDDALHIPAGARDFAIADDFRLPMDVQVLAVYPHAHYLGKLLEAYATLPGGERRWLVRIPDWDPNWQAVYYYREPLLLPKDSVISMRYRYDNSAGNVRNPNQPPRAVESGNQSTDEMGHLWLQVLPVGTGDHRLELQEAVMRHRLEKHADDFSARFNLGAVLLARMNAQEAVGMLEAALRLQPGNAPGNAEAHNMLGAAYMRLGRTREGTEQFRLALSLNPDLSAARLSLAIAMVDAGKLEEGIADLRKLSVLGTGGEAARGRLARALVTSARQLAAHDDWREAAARYREAVGIDAADAPLRNEFGEVLMGHGELAEALEQFERALALDPGNEEARQNREMVLRHLGK